MTEARPPDQVVAASGLGAEFFDEPAVFYLTYERQIRRWAALGERAREAAEEFLETILPNFQHNIDHFGLTTTIADTAGGYRQFLFAVPDTPAAEDATPAIALSFGWPRRSLQMVRSGYAAFTAVRVGPGSQGEDARELFLGGDGATVRRVRKEHAYRGAKELPVYIEVLGRDQWWANLDEYRESAASLLSTFADLFVGHLRRTVTDLHAGEGIRRQGTVNEP